MHHLGSILITFILLGATPCYAAFNVKSAGAGVLVWVFVGFIALFVVSHMIPALIQCFDLIRQAVQHVRCAKHN